jgi:predicted PurR-regulated permease PerM
MYGRKVAAILLKRVTSDASATFRFFAPPFVTVEPTAKKSLMLICELRRRKIVPRLDKMDVQVFQQTRSEQISKAMSSYENARQGYQQTLNAALAEQDPAQRQVLLQSVATQNQQLQSIIEVIQGQLTTGNQTLQDYASSTGESLEQQLQTYKNQLNALQSHGDRIQKLQELLAQSNTQVTKAESYYFGYLIAVLVLIVLLLGFFLFSKKGDADMGSSIRSPASGISLPGTFQFTPA